MIRRIFKALIAVAVGQGIGIASSILLVPAYLYAWSSVRYGEWLALFSAVGYLSTLDMGIWMYVVNRLTQAFVARDHRTYRECQHTAMAFYLGIAAAATVVSAGLAFALPLGKLLGLHETSQHTAALVAVLLALQVVWNLPLGFLIATYQTQGDLSASRWVANIQRALNVLLIFAALLFKSSMVWVAAVQLIPMLLVTVGVVAHLRLKHPEVLPGVGGAKLSLFGSFLRPSLAFGVIVLAATLGLQGSPLVVAHILGGTAVALFVTSRTVANIPRQLISFLSVASSTELTKMEAASDHRRLGAALHFLVALMAGGAIIAAASLWFVGPDLVRFWTRGRLDIGSGLLRWQLAQITLGAPWFAASSLPSTTNRHLRLSVSAIASNLLGLTGGVVLCHRFGPAGIPMAFIGAEALSNSHFIVREACAIAGERYRSFAPRLWAGFVLAASLALGISWAVHQLGLGWVPAAALTAGLALASTAAVGWVFWLRPAHRQLVGGILQRFLSPTPAATANG